MEAADVLPVRSTFEKTDVSGMPSRSPIVLMIRWLAWCGMSQASWSTDRPETASACSVAFGIARTAN